MILQNYWWNKKSNNFLIYVHVSPRCVNKSSLVRCALSIGLSNVYMTKTYYLLHALSNSQTLAATWLGQCRMGGRQGCIIRGFSRNSNMVASHLVVVLTATDRFIALWYPFRYQQLMKPVNEKSDHRDSQSLSLCGTHVGIAHQRSYYIYCIGYLLMIY